MKTPLNLILGCLTMLAIGGCLHSSRRAAKLPVNQKYSGWYLSTANAHFFIIDKPGLFSKNMAFSLPDYNRKCRVHISDSLFRYPEVMKKVGRRYFLLGLEDSTSINQDVSICAAYATLKELYTDSNITSQEKHGYSIKKIKASDGHLTIKADWVQMSITVDDLTLISNSKRDSVKFLSCRY